MKNKKQLEIALQRIPTHPDPKVEYEQYSTPSTIASDLLWNSHSLGDIEGKTILDLGCGTGIFTIGALKLNAKLAIGVDIDSQSIEVANNYISKNLKLNNYELISKDIQELESDLTADTIFQNPPFGSQRKASKGEDLKFVDKACELNSSVIYSFHMASTRDFIVNYFQDKDLEITHIFNYKFNIPKIYDFHTKESKDVDVIAIRALNDI